MQFGRRGKPRAHNCQIICDRWEYHVKGRPADAMAVYQRALEIDQKTVGAAEDATLTDLGFIASDFCAQGKIQEAEQLLKQTIELARQNPESGPLRVARVIGLQENLASLYRFEHRSTEAEPLLEEAMRSCESLSTLSPQCAGFRVSLAEIYRNEGRPIAAAYERALRIQEKNLGPDHPRLLSVLTNYFTVARALGDQAKVTELQAWIDSIQDKMEAQRQRSVQ